MPQYFKKGPLTKEDKEFILTHLDRDDEWLADKLFRETKIIKSFRNKESARQIQKEQTKKTVSEEDGYLQKLHKWPNWKSIKIAYTPDELFIVEYHWTKLHAQFRGDTTHSEDIMILKFCELEILMDRNKRDRITFTKEVERIETEIQAEAMKKAAGDPYNYDYVRQLENQIVGLKSSGNASSREYNSLFDQQMQLMEELKATRNQRLEKIIDGKQTFSGWLKLLTDIEYRTRQSREMELFKKAMEREQTRLSEYHEYEDGEIDQPLITPETLKEDNVESTNTGD